MIMARVAEYKNKISSSQENRLFEVIQTKMITNCSQLISVLDAIELDEQSLKTREILPNETR